MNHGSVPSIIVTALVIAWLATIPSSVVVAWTPVIITITPVVIAGAVIHSSTAAATFLMIVIARIAGIIRARVIKTLT